MVKGILISLDAVRCKKELNEAKNPYSKKSTFNLKLDSLVISALLFIHEYTKPEEKYLNSYKKLSKQFTISCVIYNHILRNNLRIDFEHEWRTFSSFSKTKNFGLSSVSDPDFFNYVLNKFPNKNLNGNSILNLAISGYVQSFYNFINGYDYINYFPSIKKTRKKSMSCHNESLTYVLSKIENKGCGLEFFPSVDWAKILLI